MLRSSRRFDACALALGISIAALFAPPSSASLSIAEVLYDAGGADGEREWVELWNPGDTPVDLSTWSLGWGGTSLVSGQQALSGVVAARARFLVGGPLGDDAQPPLSFDLAIDLDPDLQNGGATADAVALFDRPADSVSAETLPFDVVLYGESNDSSLLDPTGALAAVDVADAPSGASIEQGLDGVWRVQPEPTPGAPPWPVPEPRRDSMAALAAATACALRLARRRAEPQRLEIEARTSRLLRCRDATPRHKAACGRSSRDASRSRHAPASASSGSSTRRSSCSKRSTSRR